MKQRDQIYETLNYVQEALDRKEAQGLPRWPWLAMYWGAFFLISFALIDIDRRSGLRFFNIGAVAGALLSLVVAVVTAARRKQRLGETLPRSEIFIGKFVLGILVSFGVVIVMANTGRLEFVPFFQILMLLIGLELYVFGLLYRYTPLSVCALALIVWSAALAWAPAFQLTIGGVIIATAMTIATIAHRQAVLASDADQSHG